MKLKNGFVTHKTAGEHVLISTDGGFNGIVRLNETAAFIVEQLKNETTAEEIVGAMLAEYDADRETLTKAVEKVVAQLESIGALEL